MREVRSVALEEIAELIVDCPHSTPKWTNEGIVVLRNQFIKNGTLNLDNASYTDEEHYVKRTKRAAPRAGDLVLTREAPMGDVCQIPEGLKCCLGQRMVLIRLNAEQANPDYILYALQSKSLQHQIGWSRGTGTTVSNLRIPDIHKLRFKLPPLKEQKRIAHQLKVFDDKIALNRRTNETLEAIAQALFKSWFVDFDPVIDNALDAGHALPEALAKKVAQRRAVRASGKYAALGPEVRGLFPDKVVWSEELGKWVPEGWGVVTLGEAFEITMGQSPPGSELTEEAVGLPFFQGRRDFGARFPTNRIYCKTPKRVAEAGSTLISVRAPVGDCNIALERCGIGRGVAAIRARTVSEGYTYAGLSAMQTQFDRYNGEGTVFGNISGNQLRSIMIVQPDTACVREWSHYANKLWMQNRILHGEGYGMRLGHTMISKAIIY